jgi:urease accessory protein UreH
MARAKYLDLHILYLYNLKLIWISLAGGVVEGDKSIIQLPPSACCGDFRIVVENEQR